MNRFMFRKTKSSVRGVYWSRSSDEQCGVMIRFGVCHRGDDAGSGVVQPRLEHLCDRGVAKARQRLGLLKEAAHALLG